MTPYYEDDLVTLYHGDCLEVMGQLEGGVDLVFTSPPYNLGVSTGSGIQYYRKNRGRSDLWAGALLADGYDGHDDAMPTAEYEQWQRECITAMWGTLGDHGAIFYNHKPRPQRTLWHPRCLVPEDLPVRQEIIWARSGGVNFNATNFLPTHEVIIVIAKDGWRLKSKSASSVGDVWRIHHATGNDHPAPFPLDLPATAIEAAAPSLVLDPFAGSGTTVLAAKRAGVKAIGIEKSERYCEIAAERCGGPIRAEHGALDFGAAS